ncbi:uncharacterized protein LOC114191549 isoform X3 [Vigna unguiculata]|uniref:uncharacterized protein LOC114191549 isoform X3 n=1 Tax=Vigna unguiculata TaxID=3917 RepID=UPI001016CF20|nr:uncharacterized protein LOC114191549 isoform X3 [Vigna unguiculata]
MGFNSVYRSLQELFPQVDARLLRAVAIEHPKDADLAAGIVLAEVIPFVSKKLPLATPPSDNAHGAPLNVEGGVAPPQDNAHGAPLNVQGGVAPPQDNAHVAPLNVEGGVAPPQDNAHGAPLNVEAESEEEGGRLRHRQLVQDIDVGPSSAPHSVYTKPADYSLVPDLNEALDNSTLSNVNNSNGVTEKFLGMDDMKELDVLQNVEDNFVEEISSKIAMEISNCFIQGYNENIDQRRPHVDAESENLISSGICQETEPEHSYHSKEAKSTNNNGSHIPEDCETNLIEVESSEVQAVCLAQGNTLNSIDSLQSEFNAGFSSADDKTSDVEDDVGGKNEVSQYSQVCRIDLLEEIIDDAKSNKKTLFSSMESLINLMRDVQLQEQAAEQASLDAATGGSNILAMVEGYKTVLEQAKEANDMHAGEVYGEKAILATELKELQSRLLSLSDERDKSLAILNEMRQVLEARLAAAEEFKKAAENEKLAKEESAQKALAEQEKLVEKVLHESGRLQQEAEENSKLREFLMDRGQVVDMLQGEISVICQDIRLLKERFDANLPLSESFTSSQTSCKLASSGTSHKTAASDVASVHTDSSERSKTSQVTSSENLSPKGGHEEEKSKAYHNALLDDGWDIFEKDAELNSGVY